MKYYAPSTIEEALELKEKFREEVVPAAGGTDLMVQWFERLNDLKRVMSLNRVAGLEVIERQGDFINLGSMATFSELIRSPLMQESAPLLVEAVKTVGSEQIRNRGTIGGNIMNASPSADGVPALIALRAGVELSSLSGGRKFLLEELFTGPGKTRIASNEILNSINFKVQSDDALYFYEKLGQRKALACAKVTVTFLADMAAGKMKNVSLVLGAVGPTIMRAEGAEKILEGEGPSVSIFKEAARAASECCTPISDVRSTREYRTDMVESLLMKGYYRCVKG